MDNARRKSFNIMCLDLYSQISRSFVSPSESLPLGCHKVWCLSSHSVAVAVSCRGAVHLGNFSKSGVQLNLSVLVNGETGGRLKLYFVPERKTTPRAQVLELGLEAPKHTINIFSIRWVFSWLNTFGWVFDSPPLALIQIIKVWNRKDTKK